MSIITKPIRLIEAFGGIGTQLTAFKRLKANVTPYKLIEFDNSVVKTYNAVHNTSFVAQDIKDITGSDLQIIDTNLFDYVLTYSFPCTDLSIAGLKKGMSRNSGTRSGLLWEVERILKECKELPKVLIMENVPMVHSCSNIADFSDWLSFLENIGYNTVWQDLNAIDFNIPQKRNRCFAVSILGDTQYNFPDPIPLTKTVMDFIEPKVDDKYFFYTERAANLIKEWKDKYGFDNKRHIIDLTTKGAFELSLSPCICNRYDAGICKHKAERAGIIEPINNDYMVRKLTPRECWRLMGFTDIEFDAAAKVTPNTKLYSQAGNAIVINVLSAVIKTML